MNKTKAASIKRRAKKGFTLIEVLVSVSILSFGLILVVGGFAQSLNAIDVSYHNLQASLLVDEVTTQFLLEFQTEEEFKESLSGKKEIGLADYNWSVEARQEEEEEGLKKVVSTVSWTAGRRNGAVSVYTFLRVLEEDEAN